MSGDRRDLARQLAAVLNHHSVEDGSDTPDFLLAEYLLACLGTWETATRARDEWLGPNPVVRQTPKQPDAATVDDERGTPPTDPRGVGLLLPGVGLTVHYRSFGTPGGEYPPACRAATVAGVGAWMSAFVDTGGVPNPASPTDGDRRTVVQEWCPDACALVVANPDGLFFKTVAHDRASHDTPGTWQGGTWHWPIPGLCEQ